MNKKSITPNPQQTMDRVPTSQLPSALAELSEEVISSQTQASDWSHASPCPCME